MPRREMLESAEDIVWRLIDEWPGLREPDGRVKDVMHVLGYMTFAVFWGYLP